MLFLKSLFLYLFIMATHPRICITYNQIHNLVKSLSNDVKKWNPDLMLAIGGGGFIPARILRTYLDKIPILAVGLMLYDKSNKPKEVPEVIQWLDEQNMEKLKGKRVLIVDEVDDSRTTLQFCIEELQKGGVKDIATLVIHNKKKEKRGKIPEGITCFVAEEIEDFWIVYPWDALSIEDHDANAKKE